MTSEIEEQVRAKGGKFYFFQFDNWVSPKTIKLA